MAFCPKCKCEYKAGIEKCADCKVDLVESLESVSISEEEKAEMLFAEAKALEMEAMEMLEETEKELSDSENVEEEDNSALHKLTSVKPAKIYREKKEVSMENKYTAYILLTMGILGVVFVILILLDIIPLFANSFWTKTFMTICMGALFIYFIYSGITCLIESKKSQLMASDESKLTSQILAYMYDEYSSNYIENSAKEEGDWDDISDEEKYFRAYEIIRKLISDRFINLDEAYLDYLCDKTYDMYFSENNEESI